MSKDTKTFRQDLNKLVDKSKIGTNLAAQAPRSVLPAKTGVGRLKATGGDGGISSPLTETAQTRSYYTVNTEEIRSADGLLVLVMELTNEVTMTDAEGQEVKLKFSSSPNLP